MSLPKGTSLFWRKSKKRWVLNYLTKIGTRQKVLESRFAHNMKREVEAWCNQWLTSNGINPEALLARRTEEGPTIAEFSERWFGLRSVDPKCAPSTLKGNREHMRLRILPTFGDAPLAALPDRLPEVRSWLRGLVEKTTVLTARNTYFTFKAFFRDAMAEGWIRTERNALAHEHITSVLPSLSDRPAFDPMKVPLAWVQKLIETDSVPLEWRVRYALGFTTGERDGEIAGLRWADVDIDSEVNAIGDGPKVRITKAIAVVGTKGKGGITRERRPKTASSVRTLPLHAAAIAALKEWRARAWTLGPPDPTEHIFQGPTGKAKRPRSAHRIRIHLAAVGLPDQIGGKPVLFKSSRSSFASWLDDADVPEAIVRRLMGHASSGVTETHYTAKEIGRLRKAVDLIQLVWRTAAGQGSGTGPAVVPGGTGDGENELESSGAPGASRTHDQRFRKRSLGRDKKCHPRSLVVKERPIDTEVSGLDSQSGSGPGANGTSGTKRIHRVVAKLPESTIGAPSPALAELTSLRGYVDVGLHLSGGSGFLEAAELNGEGWS